MRILPRIFAPVPITTPLPMVGWRLPVLFAGAAQRHALIQQHIVADFGGFADHHAHAVIDEEAAADAAPGWISMPVRVRENWLTMRAEREPAAAYKCDAPSDAAESRESRDSTARSPARCARRDRAGTRYRFVREWPGTSSLYSAVAIISQRLE